MKLLNYFIVGALIVSSCAESGGSGSVDYLAEGMRAEEAHITYKSEKVIGGETSTTIEIEIINIDSITKLYPAWVIYSRAAVLYFEHGGDTALADIPVITVKLTEREGNSFVNSNSSNSFSYTREDLRIADSLRKYFAGLIDPSNDSAGFVGNATVFDTTISASLLNTLDSVGIAWSASDGSIQGVDLLGFRNGNLDGGGFVFEVLLLARRNQTDEQYLFRYDSKKAKVVAFALNPKLSD